MQKQRKTVTVRGPSEPPEEIARLIELVNADSKLPDVHAMMDNFSTPDRYVTELEESIAGVSPETRAFLGSPRKDLQHFFAQHQLLTSAREVLGSIAERYRSKANDLKVHDPRFSADFPISVTVQLVIDKTGRFALSDAPLFSALVGVPADRIRECAVCGRLFWAARTNSECCREKCRKTYNQRNSRKDRRMGTRRKKRPGQVAKGKRKAGAK